LIYSIFHSLSVLHWRDAEPAFHLHLGRAAAAEPSLRTYGLDGPVGFLVQQPTGQQNTRLVEIVTQVGIFWMAFEQNIQSPLLEDRKTSDEFRSAWEKVHNDRYNQIAFMMFDRIQAK
jgi:hypothetical protein